MRKSLLSTVVVLAGVGTMLVGCESSPAPTKPEARQSLQTDAQAALDRLKSQDPTLQGVLNSAYGYAMFPSVGQGGVVVGGAYGRGTVYEQGRFIGYTELQQASIGAQLGGQTYTELIVFQDRAALDRLRSGNFDLGATASAVALKAGAGAEARFQNGVAVFTKPNGGLMFDVSVNGQRLSYQPASEFTGQTGSTTQP